MSTTSDHTSTSTSIKTSYTIGTTSLDLLTKGSLTREITSSDYNSLITNSKMNLKLFLTHYWPICKDQMLDVIGSAHMTQGNFTSFTTDRFGYANSALALNGGWTQVPPGIYLDTPEFTISVWIFPQNTESWSRVFDFANGCHLDQIELTQVKNAVQNEGPYIELFDLLNLILSATTVSIMTPITCSYL